LASTVLRPRGAALAFCSCCQPPLAHTTTHHDWHLVDHPGPIRGAVALAGAAIIGAVFLALFWMPSRYSELEPAVPTATTTQTAQPAPAQTAEAAPGQTAPAEAAPQAAPTTGPGLPKLALAHEDPAGGVDHLARALALQKEGDAASAVDELRQALHHQPGDVDILWKIAHSNDALAMVALEELASVQLDKAQPLREMAQLYMEKGEYSTALEAAELAALREPQDRESHNPKGRALLAMNQHGDAVAAFREAAAQKRAPGKAWSNLGYAHLLNDEPRAALDAFSEALQRGASGSVLFNNMGLAHEKLGDLQLAENAFATAVEHNPKNRGAKKNLARIRARLEAQAPAAPPVELAPLEQTPVPEAAPAVPEEAIQVPTGEPPPPEHETAPAPAPTP
jgi:Tfp pilus assembly protein PilF